MIYICCFLRFFAIATAQLRNREAETSESPHVPLPSETSAAPVSEACTETLELLMGQYQQADPAAIRCLIERLSPVLLRFFRYQGARTDQAEDLVQDTWLRIHRVRHSYRPSEPLLPWVYAIARRARIDNFRRNLRAILHEVSTGVLPVAVAPAPDPESLSNFALLTEALPPGQREVVVMLKTGGMTIEDVARATGSTVGAVKQKAHRAYRKLRTVLAVPPGCTAPGQGRGGVRP